MRPARRPFPGLAASALIVAGGALALLLGALAFEHWGGLAPCHLCLLQRGPLAATAVTGATAAAVARFEPRAGQYALGLAVVLLVIGTGLALYHSGVERGFWAGPESCTGGFQIGAVEDFADQLKTARVIRCDTVPWRFAGLSLANYNALCSLGLALIGGRATLRDQTRP